MMDTDWSPLDSPWHFYFEGYILIPVIVRLVLLIGPSYVGLKLHHRHISWLWTTLMSIPRGRTIAINLTLGMTVPLILGLGVRLFVEPSGEDWEFFHYIPTILFGIFLGGHFIWDTRRVWKARKIIQLAIVQDVERVRGYVEKVQGVSEKLYRLANPHEEVESRKGRRVLGTGLKWGSRLLPPLGIARRVASYPHKLSRRWMLITIGRGLVFHLSPPAVLMLLFGIW